MRNLIIRSLLIILVLCSGIDRSYAAFPVKETSASNVAANEGSTKRSFRATKVAQLYAQLKHVAHPLPVIDKNGQKSGWPGITSFIASILAIAALYTFPFFFILFAILAIVFGAIGLSRKRYSGTGLALAGLIIGSLEILALIALIALLVAIFG